LTSRPPRWLDALGRAHWKQYAPVLAQAGVLTEADRDPLAAACERWSPYLLAVAVLRGPGMTQTSKGSGRVALPEVAIAATAVKQYADLMAQFGVGAAARSRALRPRVLPRGSLEPSRGRRPTRACLDRGSLRP